MPLPLKSKLPHLAREFYQGRTAILWTHLMEHRATGWLNESFHRKFREVLLHACGRYAIASPCYVLMPDHWHLVWQGLHAETDQQQATAFLTKNMSPELGTAHSQERAHDRILRENECLPDAFQSTCAYVFNNARRANLCADWREWPFLGAMVVGHPNLDPRTENFWANFWEIQHQWVDPKANFFNPAQGYRTISTVTRAPNVASSGRSGTASTP